MGVTGLWTVVQPCARPIKLETLNKKRLAVDASIWIYQFLKAVRDKEGNALRNSHVVGFFRRICKLLFFGIKPVFVFDGGAPILKRQTVSSRRARREGRREDAVRTAGKLLAVQMQRRAEEDEQRRREERVRRREEEQEEEIPENAVYVDELQMTAQERQQNRTFRKKDAYHLPNLDVDLADMGAPNDPRIMSHEELENYARQFHTGEDVNVYDFSKIDFESPFFLSLPASDRYNILNAARLRSRLRMGYSKDQLDTMFPNRMDFSKFQVERVKERNELTQRLMNINGMNGEDAMLGINNGARVAGERGKEYVLVKNEGVEGGWALGVVSNKGEGDRNKPIDVERTNKENPVDDENDAWEDDGFEDVPIEGLNRLPKRHNKVTVDREALPFDSEELAKRRHALYEARNGATSQKQRHNHGVSSQLEEADSLFVPQPSINSTVDEDMDELFEDVPQPQEEPDQEDKDLSRAIAMSLENNQDSDSASETELPPFSALSVAGPRVDRPLDFNQKNANAGRKFAHVTNARAYGAAPKPFADDSDENDSVSKATLGNSRHSSHISPTGPKVHGFQRLHQNTNDSREPFSQPAATKIRGPISESTVEASGFDGPLPFESLSLGRSVLGTKKKKPAKEAAGGFEREVPIEEASQPLPPWFSGDIREEVAKQKALEEDQFKGGNTNRKIQSLLDRSFLKRQETGEVIDLEKTINEDDTAITIESSDDGETDKTLVSNSKSVDDKVSMVDAADLVRAEPPITESASNRHQSISPPAQELTDGNISHLQGVESPPKLSLPSQGSPKATSVRYSDDDASIDWSDSDIEKMSNEHPSGVELHSPPIQSPSSNQTKSHTPEFEDVSAINSSNLPRFLEQEAPNESGTLPSLPNEESTIDKAFNNLAADDEDLGYSDPEDEELMRQLAVEAEEHARFASTLNRNSQLQNAEDYEQELRQLRNQQKKDRRDADEVTHIMVTECQQLLRLFGLPYITAPMEAEAQCAALVSMGLVDGIVTDDSDIFLFGGTRVYKNMFNQAKFVECYLSSDLEKEYSLTREKLIRFAHLLGSDYAEGLPTVGPVTALEILSEFETLEQFAEWWSSVQMAQKPSAEDTATPFRRKFRKNAAKIFLPNIFPDTRVDHAYMNPEIDRDPQPFQWGVPDLDALRQFLMATIGWSQERTDEVLVPVIKDMNRRENEGTQANITQFFGGGVGIGNRESGTSNGGGGSGSHGFAPRRRTEGKSKRMETALGRLHERVTGRSTGEGEGGASPAGSAPAASINDTGAGLRKSKKGRKRGFPPADDEGEAGDEGGGEHSSDDDDDAYEAYSRKKKKGGGTKRAGRKRGKVAS